MIICATARSVLLSFGWLSAAILTICMVTLSQVSFTLSLVFCAIGPLSLHYCTQAGRKFYAPIILTLLYFASYLIPLGILLVNGDDPGGSVMAANSWRELTNVDFTPLCFTVFSGMAGIWVAVFLLERITDQRNKSLLRASTRDRPVRGPGLEEAAGSTDTCRPRARSHQLGRLFKQSSIVSGGNASKQIEISLWRAILFWVGATIPILVLMNILGLGRTGITSRELPFKLAGILFYTKSIVIPFVAYWIIVAAVGSKNVRSIYLVLAICVVIGFIGGLIFLSRGFAITMLFVPALYLFLQLADETWVRRLLGIFVPVVIITLALGVSLIESMRDIVYSGGTTSITANIQGEELPGLKEGLSKLFVLASIRMTGLRELELVRKSGLEDTYGPVRVFLGDEEYCSFVMRHIFGFVNPGGDLAFGVAFGLWGWLFLGGMNIIVFAGTCLLAGLIIGVEEIWSRFDSKPLALFFAYYFALWIWEGSCASEATRHLLAALGCFLLVKTVRIRAA